MKRPKKMYNPEDMFIKRSNTYLGRVMHSFLKLPGRYVNSRTNQYPDFFGKERKTDATILVDLELEMEESEVLESSYEVFVSEKETEEIPQLAECLHNEKGKMIIDIEDESSKVDKQTLAKDFEYNYIIHYESGLPVYSVITTPIPLKRCKTCYISGNTVFKPIIKSYDEMDGEAKLKEFQEKYERGEYFSDLEGYELISIPRMYGEKGNEVIEEVCILFNKIKMKNGRVKIQLARCLDCLINKYGGTLEEINRLEGLINMTKLINLEKEYEDRLRQEGEEKGRQEGKLELARKLVKEYGVDEVVRISGLSKEKILNEKN